LADAASSDGHSLLQLATGPAVDLDDVRGGVPKEELLVGHEDQVVEDLHSMVLQNLPGAPGQAAQPSPPGTLHASLSVALWPLVALLVCYGVFALGVLTLFREQGITMVASIMIYVISMSTMTLTVKFVFKEYHFYFPELLTALHLLASACAGFAVLLCWRLWFDIPLTTPTPVEFLFRVLPISLCFGASIAANNNALVRMSAGMVEIMGSTTPIFSIPVTMLFGLHFNMWLLIPTCVVVLGAIVAVEPWGLSVSAPGVVFCLVAVVCRSFKAVLQQVSMTGEQKHKFDPCTLLAWVSACSSVEMLIWSFAASGTKPFREFRSRASWGLVLAILISTANAVVLNMSMLFVTRELGAVATQIIGQTKAVLIVLGSMAVFHEELSPWEIVGFVLIMGGTFWFSRKQLQSKQAAGKAKA